MYIGSFHGHTVQQPQTSEFSRPNGAGREGSDFHAFDGLWFLWPWARCKSTHEHRLWCIEAFCLDLFACAFSSTVWALQKKHNLFSDGLWFPLETIGLSLTPPVRTPHYSMCKALNVFVLMWIYIYIHIYKPIYHVDIHTKLDFGPDTEPKNIGLLYSDSCVTCQKN